MYVQTGGAVSACGRVQPEQEFNMTPKTERFEMRVDEETLERVDKWRGEQDDLPSRAEAMRRLVEVGLASRSTKKAGRSGETVEFSDGEKLIMIMLRDVYKKLKITDGDIDPEFIGSILWGGHYWAANWELSGLFHDHKDRPDDLSLVLDVLEMWEGLERAFEAMPKKARDELAKLAGPGGKDVKFPGFDGNKEGAHLSIASFLVEKLDRFSRFKGRRMNSHWPTLDMYRRMFATYEPMRPTLAGRDLTIAEVAAILNSQKYPGAVNAPGRAT
jgi:uncharacterized protein YfbU (UPF0304 family)